MKSTLNVKIGGLTHRSSLSVVDYRISCFLRIFIQILLGSFTTISSRIVDYRILDFSDEKNLQISAIWDLF